MPPLMTAGATLACSMGVAPATLLVPVPGVAATTPVATIFDSIPGTNIPTFGMCLSLGNPAVAAATAAASGVLTPQPCVPATGAPWAPASLSASAGAQPCALSTSMCQCEFGGLITVVAPAQLFTNAT